MKFRLSHVVLAAALVAGRSARAEESLAALKQQLQSLQQQVQQLQQKVVDLESAKTTPPPTAAPVATTPWSPTPPITLAKAGPAYMNVSLIADAVVGGSTERDVESLQGAHHDPNQRGFSITAAELVLDGAVDPYFKGLAALTWVLEPNGETAPELEEAWMQTTSLPWNLQARGGLFYAEFGRQNTKHPHSWAFVDQAVVLRRFFGADGLRNPGARLSWLAPTPWYTELTLGVFNGSGETAFSYRGEGTTEVAGGLPAERGLNGLDSLLYVPRLATSFNLTDNHTLLFGASAALGANDSGPGANTQIYGLDAYWKWQPARTERGFPFVSWQTEALWRRYEAAERIAADDGVTVLPAETLRDWGLYSQLLWGFRPGWIAGLRGEYVTGNDGAFASDLRTDRMRVSPNLTFLPTEFSKLRLQYNYDHREGRGSDHSVWFQVEFGLGAHAAHKF
jgi:outer membrane murein-binding lipoprotein Lpp